MSQEKLEKELEKLRAEIENLSSDDTTSREKLNQLISDLEKVLQSSKEEEEDHGIVDNVREAINHFEAEHPRATAILNDIMVTLSNMGI